MERKLATIRRVKEIRPIEGADRIELAIVDGWQCVVPKGDFTPNDFGVYIEIDSLVPCTETFKFLEPRGRKLSADGSEGYRIKSMRLRGVLSQGLLLPISSFENLYGTPIYFGGDVTDFLNIKKYEAPIPAQLAGQVKGMYPSYIKRTDEERIQNVPDYLDKYADTLFEITEKLDGSSGTFYLKDGDFGVCSRNLDLKEDDTNTFWRVARWLDIKNSLVKLNRNVALQGEVIGEGVQKNKYKIKGHQFYLFNIWDIDKQVHLSPKERVEVMEILKETSSSLQHVPIITHAKLYEFVGLENLIKGADNKSLLNPSINREGIVFKSAEVINNEIVSFKVISNKYLLDNEE